MNNDDWTDDEWNGMLTRGNRALLRSRIVAAVMVSAIVLHLEWLVFPYVMTTAGHVALLVMAYPVFLGAFALAPLFGRVRIKLHPEQDRDMTSGS